MGLVHTSRRGWCFSKKNKVLNLRWGWTTAATVRSAVSSSSSCAESESGQSLRALSQLLAQQRWNHHGTLLHLPTIQPITVLTCLTSAMATPRCLGDHNKGAWTTRGRLIWPLREAAKMYSRGNMREMAVYILVLLAFTWNRFMIFWHLATAADERV